MSRYQAVHQFHSGTSLGDAITQQMLHLRDHLRAMGFASEIFAEHVAPPLADRIHHLASYQGSADHLLLVHHSMGNAAFDQVISLANDIVTIYHNITPEHYFPDPALRRWVRLGREQLGILARRSQVGVAASNFNRRELLAAGFWRPEVLPVRTDFSELAVSPELALSPETDRWRSSDWLFVGRVVANKCQGDLVGAFAVYAREFDPQARLVLVGDTGDAAYAGRVRKEAARLGVSDRVVMLGKVPAPQLKSAFAGAGVFVSLSEHEGFGVPVLEAMAAGLPVVALGAAAVPETMGGAGVLLRTKDPATVACTVQALRADADLRQRLVERQFRRVGQVQAFDTRDLLARVINRASGGACPLEVQIQGPFETSYSLAVTNRRLAVGLAQTAGTKVSIYATEGPGDYQPRASDLARVPEATSLYHRSAQVPYPHVVIRQMHPPRVIDSPGSITCEYFGWEESRVPPDMVADFNRYLSGVGVTSGFVRDVLRDEGVDVPICVVANGVDPPDPEAIISAPELDGLRSFRFLNIGSGFPRKGVDVLLRAFFDGFDGASDVSLVLKTFPNPHNQVGELVSQLRASHPHPPDVRWIDRDLTDQEIHGLYNLATCYVHPARGEGFGLPVAEAMAAGVPVISLEYSGLADFVSPETATTIGYQVEPARSHFDLPGSTWAEPDQAGLASAMRALVEEPGAAAVVARVDRARQLIATRFSWAAAIQRWQAFLEDLEYGAQVTRVAMVSTWNSRCGIAENTRYLLDRAGPRLDAAILANKGVEILDQAVEVGVTRCWSHRWSPGLDELSDTLRLSEADLVHFQFNFGFFELGHLARLVDQELLRRPVVMSLHRTRDIEIDGEVVSLAQIAPTLSRVDQLIVHQHSDVACLAEMGLVDNVSVVPLGTAPCPPVTPEVVRQALGLSGRPVIATFGFLLRHKGLVELLGAVDALRRELGDLCLLALCARHPDVSSAGYEQAVRDEVARLGLEDNVILHTDYLPDQVARALLRAGDAIVLPYRATEESSSAALRFVLPLERPIIASDLAIFADSREALYLVDPADPRSLEDAVRRVLLDPALQADLAGRAAADARRTRWERVVADHLEIYARARAARARRASPAQ